LNPLKEACNNLLINGYPLNFSVLLHSLMNEQLQWNDWPWVSHDAISGVLLTVLVTKLLFK